MKFFISYYGKYPVRCVKNIHGAVFEVVRADNATKFDNETDARGAAALHGLKPGEFSVERYIEEKSETLKS